jgi:hypothetical protein
MFTFGSQINPSLGRSDFSAILQGGQARAQGIARAGEIQGQSLAQLGAIAAKGIETYVQKQEQKKQQAAATDFVANVFKANPFLSKGFNLPTDKNGEFDKGALKEVINLLGGPVQAVQVTSGLDQMSRARQQQEQEAKMQAMKLSELERQVAGREALNRSLSASPAQRAISAGGSFESLPTGVGAFLPQGPRNTAEFISRAQSSGAPADLWLPQAIQYSQIEENVAKAGPKPELGFATPEEALKKSSELAKGRAGVTPSFNVVQGRYFPIFREQEPGAFERETDKLAAQSAQKRLDKFTSDYDNAIAGGTSATMILEGLNAGKTTGIFRPMVTFLKRVAEGVGVKDLGVAEDELINKGIAGQQATQISLLARGLGSMSNADREFYVATTPSITDSTLANKYFAEMAKENEKFAKQDQALIRQMQNDKVPTQEIVNNIEALRENRNVARDVYRRVVGGGLSANAEQFTREPKK